MSLYVWPAFCVFAAVSCLKLGPAALFAVSLAAAAASGRMAVTHGT